MMVELTTPASALAEGIFRWDGGRSEVRDLWWFGFFVVCMGKRDDYMKNIQYNILKIKHEYRCLFHSKAKVILDI